MTTDRIIFFVPGTPETEGSTKAMVRDARVRVLHDNPRLHPWRTAVTRAARAAADAAGWEPKWDGPVSVTATFRLPRPKSSPKSRTLPWVRPDLDKLQRAVGDALAPRHDPHALLAEDSRIVHWDARKRYVKFEPAGALITITRLNPEKPSTHPPFFCGREIHTVKEIEALPEGTVIRDARGIYYEVLLPGALGAPGTDTTYHAKHLTLPAILIEENLK